MGCFSLRPPLGMASENRVLGPGKYCEPPHPTEFAILCLELNGILRRGEQHLPGSLPAKSPDGLSNMLSCVQRHPVTWRAMSRRRERRHDSECIRRHQAFALPRRGEQCMGGPTACRAARACGAHRTAPRPPPSPYGRGLRSSTYSVQHKHFLQNTLGGVSLSD
jgi:hypothetical protein